MTEHKTLPFVESTASFANPKYRGTRMPPPEWVEDPDERSHMYVRESIRVYNARLLSPPPTLAANGFQLVEAETQVTNLHDTDAVTTRFYAECSDLVKAVTGCNETKVMQHQYRNGFGGLPKGHPRGNRPTANQSEGTYGGLHADVSPYSEDGFEKLANGKHFQMYNVWRSTDLQRNIFVMPLAICDMSTVANEDIVAADAWSQTETPRRLVSLRLVYNPNQRWYYFPRMTPQETLIFKQYDTLQETPSLRTAFHGAIQDPTTPDDAPLRETIEVRLLALFDEETDREARKARFQAEVPDAHDDGRTSDWIQR
ncbi:hypothetical protein IH992_21745 [Candidatus Poribacteria bacterium]|nr:hypothetical protein [Candidatus Poribacteria bacterium]